MTEIILNGIAEGTYDGVSNTFTITAPSSSNDVTLRDDEDGSPDSFVSINANFSEVFFGDDHGTVQLIAFKTDGGGNLTHVVGQFVAVTPEGAFAGISVNDIYVYGSGAQSSGTITGFTDLVGTNAFFCFAQNTLIATPDGQQTVQDLCIGDEILTKDGTTTTVLWIGHQTVHSLFYSAHMQPVRICVGALGNGLPHTDLTVTADHGMVIDGYVINASALINGTTIHWVPVEDLADCFTVYHVETANHDVILANGALAETFVDAITRSHFDNYDEFLSLYGVERPIMEMNIPRITSRRLVPHSIKRRLNPKMPMDIAKAS